MSYRWPWVVQPGGLRTTGRELKGKEHNPPLGSHVSIDYSRQLRYKGKKKRVTIILIPAWERVRRRFLIFLRAVPLQQGAVHGPWCPPSCGPPPPSWRELGRAGPGEGGHVSESVLRAAALPSETAQFNQCPGTPGQGWGGSLHSRGGRGRLLGPGRTRSSWAEAAGAAHRAQVWDSAEVRGRRSGAPRCGFLWGDRGTAWGSGKPLWAGCSWSAVLQEGGRQQKRA